MFVHTMGGLGLSVAQAASFVSLQLCFIPLPNDKGGPHSLALLRLLLYDSWLGQ